jgi:hypothetical protein
LHPFHQTYFEFYAFNFVEMADLPSDVEPLPVRWSDLINKNYAEVKRQLSLTDDPNKVICNLSITGLEYSVLFREWELFLIFFLAGADPNQNLFDGGVWEHTGELLHQYEAFRSKEGEFQPVPGFRGLQLIMDAVVFRYPKDVVSKMRAGGYPLVDPTTA